MTFELHPTISLETMRCYGCRKWWAYERGPGQAQCPFCAQVEIEQVRSERDAALRSARAYKAAAKRARSRK